MNELTCDICGKVCKKPSSLKSHTRWAHGAGSPAVTQKAELAEYKALEGKVVELVEGYNSLARKILVQDKALSVLASKPAPAVAPLAESSGISVGGMLAVVAILGTAIWANTTDGGRAAMAQSEELREAKRRR